MKTLLKLIAFISIVVHSGSVLSQEKAASVSLSTAIDVASANANETVFHITMPEYSTLTAGIVGNDRFASFSENSSSVSIKLSHKTAYINIDGGAKQYSVGLGTICGTSVSIVINAYVASDKQKLQDVLPKVNLIAPEICNL